MTELNTQMASSLDALKIKIFADGADLDGILKLAANPLIKGFTTNPTLMRKAGVTDYKGFAAELIQAVPNSPISFEVFADDLPEMADQAREISTWGSNVNVKIPVTNTKGESCVPIIKSLSERVVPEVDDSLKLVPSRFFTTALGFVCFVIHLISLFCSLGVHD